MLNTIKIMQVMLLALVLSSLPLYSADLNIGPTIEGNGRLMVNFTISSYQKTDIIEAIKRGIVVKVVYEIEIVQKSFFNAIYKEVIASRKIKRSVKYDYWSRSFIVQDAGRKINYNNDDSMFAYFFSAGNIDVTDSSLVRGKDCYIRYRAVLSSVELYFPMNYIFRYIVGIWDFDTGWVNSRNLE
jgi:hypothetical protein